MAGKATASTGTLTFSTSVPDFPEGRAALFGGAQDVYWSSAGLFTDPVTLCLLVRRNGSPSGGSFTGLAGNHVDNSNGYNLLLRNSDCNILVARKVSGTTRTVYTSTPLPDLTTTLLTLTSRDLGSSTYETLLYYNTAPVAVIPANSGATAFPNAANDDGIGYYPSEGRFRGWMGQVARWHTAFSPADVARLYEHVVVNGRAIVREAA